MATITVEREEPAPTPLKNVTITFDAKEVRFLRSALWSSKCMLESKKWKDDWSAQSLEFQKKLYDQLREVL
ncbi:hypothetical protein SAMN02745126_03985 [Enhydrobacter aerosaccus]|uniref:Uncharacterized protein n=1 Tax=Enhydrobacter aerosaccus TaxID=225324 RepID=A0A1T4RNI4_9HYPH|nr:hypothetical protein SAMN02745126_03985 [Enhydrobacter aerosaccus]